MNCKSLSSVTIPDSVTSMGAFAFSNCESLSHITIPDGISDIHGWSFSNTAYYNNEKNWEGDVLYLGNYLIKAKSIAGAYTIKNGTKVIASEALCA